MASQKIMVRKTELRYGAGSRSKKHIDTLAAGAKRQDRKIRIIKTKRNGKRYYKLYESKMHA